MKKVKYILFGIVVVAFFVAGCVGTEPINLGPSEIDDTGNLDPDTPAYFADIVSDEDFIAILDELFLGGTLSTSFDISTLENGSLAKSLDNVVNNFSSIQEPKLDVTPYSTSMNDYDRMIHFINLIASKENLINKMKQFRTGVNNLLQYEQRYDYVVEITGTAKTKVENVLRHFKGLDPEYTVDHLYGDFRDIMILNLFIEPFIFIHDNQQKLITMIENASRTEEMGPSNFLRQEFITEVSSFTGAYPEVDFASPTYLDGLKTFLYNVSAISPDVNYLDLFDIFVNEAFVYTWVNDFIHLSDLLLKTIVEINNYEVSKTNEYGFRNDGKITLWTFGNDPGVDYMALTLEWYDEPLGPLPDGMTGTLNNQPIDDTMQVIDVLQTLDTVLPNGELNLTLSYSTPIDLEHSINVDFSLVVDFQKLNVPEIDLKDCNLKVNSELFEMLNVASITEFSTALYRIANDIYDPSDVVTVLYYFNFITSNLEFVSFNFDEASTTTTIVFEYNLENGAVVATLTLTFEGFTLPQLINPLSFSQDAISNLEYLGRLFLKKIEVF
ncbi:hypothetical protein [Thermosipho atlanticus]|uniref:Lipoprotein n=1 Tax=Thermosipho atlanticus DSM 15807 TaxID=1123380 RepID=A0A1M5T326_9BACT|nr:hypothetical protein [Thermosipho atlanticus]SHH45086.1 hypothetical protein SAMN02745199_1139 [Thermosipho atlanticus DSM 15807]